MITEEIRIICKSCGRRYILGKDAAVVTAIGILADFQRAVVIGDGSSFIDNRSRPDLVASFGGSRRSIEASTIRSQITEISRISYQLSLRNPRWWKCQACGTIQKYKPMKAFPKSSEGKMEIEETKDKTSATKHLKTIQTSAASLEEAREKILSQIPEGLQILSEETITTLKTGSINGIADTIESAFKKAKSKLPAYVIITDKKVLVTPETQAVRVEAFSEHEGIALLKPQLKKYSRIKKIILLNSGNKGILGLGKKPNIYEAQILLQAIVEITYKGKVILRAIIGKK